MPQFAAALGFLACLGLAWALSEDRRKIPWSAIGWGTALPLLVGVLVFLLPGSGPAMVAVNQFVVGGLDAALAGARLVFGPLAAGPGQPGSIGVILLCQVFPIAIVVSALSAVLYQIGLLQIVVRWFAVVFHRLLGISGAEALTASANLFVGVESALVVRPYLERMTRSELLVLLAAGMATSASTVLGLYVLTVNQIFPGAAGHLAAATLMAVPAAIAIAKLLVPERESPVTAGWVPGDAEPKNPGGILGAVISGAMDGLHLVLGLAACLIAIIGLLAMADWLLALTAGWVRTGPPPTIAGLLGWLFWPVAWLAGVAPADVAVMGQLLGKRLIAGEYLAYLDLVAAAKSGAIHDPRTVVVASYVLCGFAHLASVAIFVGGTAALVPSRRADLARLGPKALLAATLATLMTGCIAAMFCSGNEIVLAAQR